ncbi:acyltransferase family protein [Parachitinimonas caeni]|uniref:Acyltransferase n=1 Tax=Parachitinimonas caeni TaxID=3031301 RepID=A0ABT7DS56_9NEIS|nr:acyltransferase [Parachitinimonas caeni]MDK2122902.1 acyltransferase [Parachitinimonas caeni]
MAPERPEHWRLTRLYELDLLRLLAAAAVLLFHYGFRGYIADDLCRMPTPTLGLVARYGYLGVELFFLISGFVILLSAEGRNATEFVKARALRLFPALWLACSLTAATAWLLSDARFTPTLGDYFANMALLAGFIGRPLVDGSYWSLYVEIVFYAAIAAAIALRQLGQIELWLILWLALACLIDLFPFGNAGFKALFNYAPYFVGGCVAYRRYSLGTSPLRQGLFVASWVLASAHALRDAAYLSERYAVRFEPLVVTSLIAVFFGGFWLLARHRTTAWRQPRWAIWGALTYPLYLIHQHIGYMLFNRLYPAWPSWLLVSSCSALVLALAWLIHHHAELPLRRWLQGLLWRS